MFIGHVAIALAGKRVRESVPLAALLVATFGPDVIEITLLAIERWQNMPTSLGSHSIPAVALGAAVVGAAYWLRRDDGRGGALLCAIYASHWAADLLTGSAKPTWLGGPRLGLSLYDHPTIDFFIESALLLGAWVFFWPARDSRYRPRAIQIAALIALVVLQLVFNASERLFGVRGIKGVISGAHGRGNAFFAAIGGEAESHRLVVTSDRPAACLLHDSRPPSSMSELWRTTAGRAAWSLSYASPAVRRSSTSRRRRRRT
jgi:hypothetical protein